MKNLHVEHGGLPRVLDVEAANVTEPAERFTHTEFLREAGSVIGVCLGLGLLMQVLLG